MISGRRGIATSGLVELVELSGGLQVRLLDGTRHGSRSWLVDAESEMHAPDSAWTTMETSFEASGFKRNHSTDMILRVLLRKNATASSIMRLHRL